MRSCFSGAFVAATASLLIIGSCLASTAELQLQSQPGDPVGQGQNFDIVYNPPSASIFPLINRTINGGQPTDISFAMDSSPSGDQFATLLFGTYELGIPIQAGVYDNAQRYGFESPGHPGLDVGFENRGSTTVTGSFTIDYVTFDPTPKSIETFKATFEQHCDGLTPALFGTFTFDAQAPEPTTLSLLIGGLLLLRRRARRWRPGNAS